MITASICTIGDEILIGQITDTNSSLIAKALNNKGIRVNLMISTGDNEPDIKKTLTKCVGDSDIVIITGGLGPTKDDITKKVLAEMSGSKKYVKNVQQMELNTVYFKERGIKMLDINIRQAYVPETCTVIANKIGTAPIMQFSVKKDDRQKIVFSMPGVPFETEHALPEVIKAIESFFKTENIFHKTICTIGIPESELAKTIEDWETGLPENIHLAYLPDAMLGVRLRMSIYGVDKITGEKELEEQSRKLYSLIRPSIYGEGDENPAGAVGKILMSENKTLCVAESCTGGMICSVFTENPGSSKYFYGGIICYDISVKTDILKVNKEVVEKYGVVSRQCAEAMATEVKNLLGTDYSISITGFAGPDGGTKENPVGTAWIAVCGKKGVISQRLFFRGTRNINRKRFTSHAIDLLRRNI
ncbi:MAG: CinA family nicotinamide mononucleotide deamidase-related protein [Bacteroidales bacterium]|jgi:nicotinamide-nucleotide amidase|nr:CinA family nicotinamide mononucleotide deamidase-related protein [Bacteroidales bacterium]